MEVLIVYGTRYGASALTAQEIASVLSSEGFSVKVADAKKEKIKDLSPYGLVVVGSGMQMGKWTGEAEDFLKKHQKELTAKKHAVFACTMKMVPQREGKPEEVEKIRKASLDDKIAKYSLQPIAVGFFGGILDYGKMNVLFRRTLGMIRPQLESDGFKETEPGVYDLRDREEIRSWARELAQKAR
ncbi:MAG: flavodoxin domain-containing protein [Candidatus Bathyarchaeota archaeon]|nr:flavodoxin domain-containing protein [Candidatus Bathyarchaeota archaeon]